MKTYTAKVIEATAGLSDRTQRKSQETVGRLTRPSPVVARIGSIAGGSVGVVLLVAGGIGLASGAVWAWGSMFAGAATIASNLVYIRRIGSEQR